MSPFSRKPKPDPDEAAADEQLMQRVLAARAANAPIPNDVVNELIARFESKYADPQATPK